MIKAKAIKGILTCLLALGMLAGTSWAMGKKPAESEEPAVMSEQKADSEKTPGVAEATEEKGRETVEVKGTPTTYAEEYVSKEILFLPWGDGEGEAALREITMFATGASIRGTITERYGAPKLEIDKDGNIYIWNTEWGKLSSDMIEVKRIDNPYIYKYGKPKIKRKAKEEYKLLKSIPLKEAKRRAFSVERFEGGYRYEFIKSKEPTPFAYKRYDEKEWTIGIRILDKSNKAWGEIIYGDPHICIEQPIVGIDRSGNIYLLIDTTGVICAGPNEWRLEVHKYSKEGEFVGKIELCKEINYTNRYEGQKSRIKIDKDGNIYQLLPKEDGAHIIKWEVK